MTVDVPYLLLLIFNILIHGEWYLFYLNQEVKNELNFNNLTFNIFMLKLRNIKKWCIMSSDQNIFQPVIEHLEAEYNILLLYEYSRHRIEFSDAVFSNSKISSFF